MLKKKPKIFLTLLIGLLLSIVSWSLYATQTYYIDATNGNDGNSGTSTNAPWRTITKVNSVTFQQGDQILFKRGESWSGELSVNSSGNENNPIIFDAYGDGNDPVIYRITVYGNHIKCQHLTVDHNKESGDAVRIRGGRHCTLKKMIIRNGANDGIDAAAADSVLVDSCTIHHFLAGSFTNQADAHGISVEDTKGITIRNTEVHHVSGDAFQSDPNREGSNDILIENCYFWTGPLEEDFNDWNAGESPGENAIDTKVEKDSWETVERMRITLNNITAHGWTDNGYITNRAAFNMKEKIEAVFDGVTIYDCEIAFRIRGTRGNANATIMNGVIYNCEKAVRAEDDLSNLVMFNNTFGENIATQIQYAGGSGGTGSWEVKNNSFMGSKPGIASHESNMITNENGFINSASGDYHLTDQSNLIDAGIVLSEVTHDRDDVSRPQGDKYDVGAYEFTGTVPVELFSFQASINDHSVILIWETASEHNNYGFEIERRSIPAPWQTIDFVNGHHTSSTSHSYQYVDDLSNTQLKSSKLQYRLKQLDVDGSFQYSNILNVQIKPPSDFYLGQNYPNPFNDSAAIEYRIPEGMVKGNWHLVDLSIYNEKGQIVKTLVHKIQGSGEYNITWHGKNEKGEVVSSGTYFYVLKINGKFSMRKKLIFLK